MKLNYFTKQLSLLGRWMITTAFCMSAIAFFWQGAFFLNTSAMATPNQTLIAADVGDTVQEKTSKDAGRAKNFIDDTADKVKEAAKSNASKVENATDGDGNIIERKAKEDAATIQKRADEDETRTKSAVNKTKNAVEKAVDNIKDAFN